MRVLVLGNGAREHSLVWKLSKSTRLAALFACPGNAGTSDLAENIPGIDPLNPERVVAACREKSVNTVVVGPEGPLAAGIVDALDEAGIPAIGPGRSAARLESSKTFAKDFMERHGIPTAVSRNFTDYDEAASFLRANQKPVVLKKSGLAAGKGVLESQNPEEQLGFAEAVLESDSLIVEEFLKGHELSLFLVMDGENYRLLPGCADYKKAGEGDRGPNTGGMGAICPVPWLEPEALDRIERTIISPTVEGLASDGLSYTGFLYIGLMITEDGPRVLEYNVRLGDPESQVLLPILEEDLGSLLSAMKNKRLHERSISKPTSAAVGVVIASPGYPGSYPKGIEVESLPSAKDRSSIVFHAATSTDEHGKLRTGGGRCFTAVGLGRELLEARGRAYKTAAEVRFEGAWFRSDIGGSIFGI